MGHEAQDYRQNIFNHSGRAQIPLCLHPGSLPDALTRRRIGQEPRGGPSQSRCVAHRHKEARFLVIDRGADPSTTGGDHGAAASHRFGNRNAE